MEKLYDLLRIVESVQLAPSLLEPEPVEVVHGAGTVTRRQGNGANAGPAGPDGTIVMQLAVLVLVGHFALFTYTQVTGPARQPVPVGSEWRITRSL